MHGEILQFLMGDGSVEYRPLTMVALFVASMIVGLWLFSGPSGTLSVSSNGPDRGKVTSEQATSLPRRENP